MHPGAIVAERFEVVRRARRGGMATIYQAIDRRSGGSVALKVLRGDDPIDAARFADEARILAELRQPGIVEYVDHGRTVDGSLYLVMEWLDGEDLSSYLKHTRPTIDEAVRIARRAADALIIPHERGLVHRDIKPGNLFLVDGKPDRIRLLDFGVALLQGTGMLETPAGTTVGTPAYMAPEQARAKAVDVRADIFSLGCVLFRCLARRAPFVGENPMAIMLKVVLEDPPRLSELVPAIPLDLDALVARMLDKRPERRPANAAEVCEMLSALGTPQGLQHSQVRRVRRPSLTGGEQRLLSVVLIGRRGRRIETDDDEGTPGPGLSFIVGRHGGRLEQLADGSAVVALQGRGAASDQAAHAARCALAIRRALPDATIALTTGRGEVAEHRHPVGEVIDRATMLIDLARGTRRRGDDAPILVDHVTAGLLDIRFDVEGYGFGLRLRGERQHRGRTRTLLGRQTPCVGRVRELGFLQGLFEECASDSVARSVLVTSPPGVGKSRLRDELVRRIRERHDVNVLIGHGDPMRAGSAFGLIGRVVRNAADVLDGEPLSVRQNKLRARVRQVIPDDDAERVTGFLGEVAGVPLPDGDNVLLRNARNDAIVMGDHIHQTWLDWLAAESRDRPTLLVLEDLHWGDRSSVRLVDAALSAHPDRPLMVLALARPEVRKLFPQLWHGRDLTQLELGHLSRKACATLAREVLGDAVDDEVVADLVARAAGNAFYLEELIRSVAEGHRGALPETVLAMVQARLEGLDAEARQILRAASIFGRVFWRGGVEVLLGGSDSQQRVGSWLAELAVQEVITRRPGGALPGEDEYVFRHALLRDAAYRTLTREDRKLGHRLAGEWLERVGERDAIVLAEHFERGDEPARALSCYRRAAEQALEGNDFEAALSRSERAVERGAAGEELGALRLLQAEAHRWLGAHPETLHAALEAMDRVARGSIAWYSAAGLAAIAAGNVGDVDRLAEVSDTVYAQAPPPAVAGRYAVALARIVDRMLGAGQYAAADRILERIERVHGESPARDPIVDAWVHRVRGFRALYNSDPAGFLVAAARSAASFDSAGDLRYACMQRGNTGYGLMHIGAYDDAENVLREALETAERLHLSNVITSVSVDLGYTLTRLDQSERGRDMLQRAIRECVRAGNPRLEGPARIYMSETLDDLDELAGAEREARLAVNVLGFNPPARATALAALAHVLLRRDRSEEALAVAGEALALLASFGGISEGESQVRLSYAESLDANGRFADSRAAIAEAHQRLLERAQRIENTAWRAAFLTRVPANARTIDLADKWA